MCQNVADPLMHLSSSCDDTTILAEFSMKCWRNTCRQLSVYCVVHRKSTQSPLCKSLLWLWHFVSCGNSNWQWPVADKNTNENVNEVGKRTAFYLFDTCTVHSLLFIIQPTKAQSTGQAQKQQQNTGCIYGHQTNLHLITLHNFKCFKHFINFNTNCKLYICNLAR